MKCQVGLLLRHILSLCMAMVFMAVGQLITWKLLVLWRDILELIAKVR